MSPDLTCLCLIFSEVIALSAISEVPQGIPAYTELNDMPTMNPTAKNKTKNVDLDKLIFPMPTPWGKIMGNRCVWNFYYNIIS